MAKDFTLQNIATEFVSGETEDVVNPLTFIESPWGLSYNLFPVQRFIIKAFYGLALDDSEKYIHVPDQYNDKTLFTLTEKGFLDYLYDEELCNTNKVEGKSFSELVLVLGRRGGKSSISSCIAAYEIYKLIKRGDPAAFYHFPPEEVIGVTTVAPTDDQASIVFNMILRRVLTCPYLRDRPVNQTLQYFNLQTDVDRKRLSTKKRASITVKAGGCASNSLRGGNNIIIIMDEMAFFIDNNGRFSGSEVYRALKPSIASFGNDGKILCTSSPYAKYGQFYDVYQHSFEETEKTLMFQMPSAMVNPTITPEFLRSEYRRNKIEFITEFGGEFSDKVTSWIDDENKFLSCVDKGPLKTRGETGVDYYMGVDLGLKNDGTAIAIAHRDFNTNKVVVDYADVWFSSSSDVWDSERSIYKAHTRYAAHEVIPIADIVKEIQELCKWFPIKSGWFDQYNGYALYEMLHEVGLKQFRMESVTDTVNHRMYQLLESLYGEQKIEICNNETMISEFLSLEAERKSKGKIEVRAPNKLGAHDDMADAVARAVWEVYNVQDTRGHNMTIGGMAGNLGATTMRKFKNDRQKMHGSNAQRTVKVQGRRRIR